MDESFAKLFVDPTTREPLTLRVSRRDGPRIIEGQFESSTSVYPIVRGIPRFAGYQERVNYVSTFGYQWNKWATVQFEHQNVGKPMEGHTLKMWEKLTGNPDVTGQLVLDIGCGPGRFADIMKTKGARVVGLDFSFAVEAAVLNFPNSDNVCICQADALNLPFADGTFDAAFTHGSLMCTPHPTRGIEEAFRTLRRGGWLAAHVYPAGGYYDLPIVHLWRRIFQWLWPIWGHYPPLIYSYCTVYGLRPLSYVPILRNAIRLLFPFVRLPDIKWSLLDTFDSVTPQYATTHETFEVFQWLKNAGFSEIEPTKWGSTCFRGIRPN